jgi:hypothetical protein
MMELNVIQNCNSPWLGVELRYKLNEVGFLTIVLKYLVMHNAGG